MLTILLFYWLLQNGANSIQHHQESHQRETIHDKFVIFAILVRQKNKQTNKKQTNKQKQKQKTIEWAKYVHVINWSNFCVFSLVTKNVKSRLRIAFSFKWAPVWNLISKKEINYIFQKKIIYTIQKRHNFACDNYIFPKTKENENKQ